MMNSHPIIHAYYFTCSSFFVIFLYIVSKDKQQCCTYQISPLSLPPTTLSPYCYSLACNNLSLKCTIYGLIPALRASDLEKFLVSIGKEPSFVDLEANPPVGKDQPPDLAGLVPTESISLPELPASDSSAKKPAEKPATVNKQVPAVEAKVLKPSNKAQVKDTKPIAKPTSSIFTDADHFTEEFLNRTLTIIQEQITDETIKQHGAQLGDVISNKVRKNLSGDFKNLAIMFKNSAYAQGFKAAGHSQQSKHL